MTHKYYIKPETNKVDIHAKGEILYDINMQSTEEQYGNQGQFEEETTDDEYDDFFTEF